MFRPLPASDPSRSAVPLAAIGIIGLGLVPVIGGPEQPLHWAMTAGMVGFGVLLRMRHRLRRPEGPLSPVPLGAPATAGHAVGWVTLVIASLIAVIFGARLRSGGAIGALSLAMPALGLAWLAWLARKSLREPVTEQPPGAASAERPSKRPPAWDAVPTNQPSSSGSNRQVNA